MINKPLLLRCYVASEKWFRQRENCFVVTQPTKQSKTKRNDFHYLKSDHCTHDDGSWRVGLPLQRRHQPH